MAGMSNMIVPIIVLCVCLVSCVVSSMAMGSFKNMFGGIGSLFSGDAFKGPSLEKVADFKSGVCRDCANKNWTGSVTAFGKPVQCSEARSKC